MPAATFRHSVGVLLTHEQTSPFPDEHSFVADGPELYPRLGFGASGIVTLPTRNPPEGHVCTVHYLGGFCDEMMTNLSDLLAEHKARYKEARIFVADALPDPDGVIARWVSGGCQPGSRLHGWGTDDDPAYDQELIA